VAVDALEGDESEPAAPEEGAKPEQRQQEDATTSCVDASDEERGEKGEGAAGDWTDGI